MDGAFERSTHCSQSYFIVQLRNLMLPNNCAVASAQWHAQAEVEEDRRGARPAWGDTAEKENAKDQSILARVCRTARFLRLCSQFADWITSPIISVHSHADSVA